MNKRVKELAVWAREETTDEISYLSDMHNRPLTLDECAEIFEEKFSKFIINDIQKIITGSYVPQTLDQDIGPYQYWNHALGTVSLEIEQHFGVEE